MKLPEGRWRKMLHYSVGAHNGRCVGLAWFFLVIRFIFPNSSEQMLFEVKVHSMRRLSPSFAVSDVSREEIHLPPLCWQYLRTGGTTAWECSASQSWQRSAASGWRSRRTRTTVVSCPRWRALLATRLARFLSSEDQLLSTGNLVLTMKFAKRARDPVKMQVKCGVKLYPYLV